MSKLVGKQIGNRRTVNAMGAPITFDPTEDLAIDRSRLLTEMAEQPSLYAYYADLHETAEALLKQAKYERHCLREDLERKFRGLPNAGSESKLKTMVNSDPAMRTLHTKVMQAEARAAKLKVFREAFLQRKDMLSSINAKMGRDVTGNKPITPQAGGAAQIKKPVVK